MVTAQGLGLRPRLEVVKLGLLVGNSGGLFPAVWGRGARPLAGPAGTLQAFWNTDHTPGTVLA